MHAIQLRPGKCIFCSFKSQYGAPPTFTTTISAARQVDRHRSTQAARKQSNALPPTPDYSNGSRTRRTVKGTNHFPSQGFESPATKAPKTNEAGIRPTIEPNVLNPIARSMKRGQYAPNTNPKDTIRQFISQLADTIKSRDDFRRLGLKPPVLRAKLELFKRQLLDSENPNSQSHKLLERLTRVCENQGPDLLTVELRNAFLGFVQLQKLQRAGVQTHLSALSDFRYPYEWFPATRGVQRELHLHVGPTNSGKTYHALKRLEQAKTGVYAGPLRLLAHEVYMKLNARGIRCNLVTGDDRRTADDNPSAPMASCTVEMVPLNSTMDVAVIDEIQMLGSADRGWAWTQAVLGLKAKELHMCGEERALPIIQQLAALCGERLHIHRYQRLTPLLTMPSSLGGNLRSLKKGDCVVAFSIPSIHATRQAIEKSLGIRCAVIYGTLPAETRVQQAKLFNEPDNNYDVLVASNAVGMGLNLKIKRMVFQSSHMFVDGKYRPLPVADVKQIAGRAGRYIRAKPDVSEDGGENTMPTTDMKVVKDEKIVGWVTTLEKVDYAHVSDAMQKDAEPIKSAGILPPAVLIERFAKLYPAGTPFAYLLMQLEQHATTNTCFFMCNMAKNLLIADAIEPVRNLGIMERLIFCAAPLDMKRSGEPALMLAFANIVAHHRCVTVLDVEELDLELLDSTDPYTREYLRKLEALHKGVTAFLWLSYRFKASFVEQDLAIHLRELVEQKIHDVLDNLAFDYERMRRAREKAIREAIENQPHREEDNDNQYAAAGARSGNTDVSSVSPASEGVSEPSNDEEEASLPEAEPELSLKTREYEVLNGEEEFVTREASSSSSITSSEGAAAQEDIVVDIEADGDDADIHDSEHSNGSPPSKAKEQAAAAAG